jgi:pilus assembly protein Flp/PilA
MKLLAGEFSLFESAFRPSVHRKQKSQEITMFKFIRNEEGATAIEYGLIAAGIAVAIAVVVFTVGDKLEALFTGIASKL